MYQYTRSHTVKFVINISQYSPSDKRRCYYNYFELSGMEQRKYSSSQDNPGSNTKPIKVL